MITRYVNTASTAGGDGTNSISISSWPAQFLNVNYLSQVDYRLKNGSVLKKAGIGPALDSDVPTDSIGSAYRYGPTVDVGPFAYSDYKAKLSSSGMSSQSGM